jgi:hypothetical protein
MLVNLDRTGLEATIDIATQEFANDTFEARRDSSWPVRHTQEYVNPHMA